MKAVIIANGDLPSPSIVRSILDQSDLCICADGGANAVRQRGIIPNYIIGDLDSIDPATREYYQQFPAVTPIIHQTDQNTTDLEKCLTFLCHYPVSTCYLLGVTGDRMDHVLYTLHLLTCFTPRMNLMIITDTQSMFLVKDRYEFKVKPVTISFFGFPEAMGVTTRGFEYELTDCQMSFATLQSLSNRIISLPAVIDIRSGQLLVIISGNAAIL